MAREELECFDQEAREDAGACAKRNSAPCCRPPVKKYVEPNDVIPTAPKLLELFEPLARAFCRNRCPPPRRPQWSFAALDRAPIGWFSELTLRPAAAPCVDALHAGRGTKRRIRRMQPGIDSVTYANQDRNGALQNSQQFAIQITQSLVRRQQSSGQLPASRRSRYMYKYHSSRHSPYLPLSSRGCSLHPAAIYRLIAAIAGMCLIGRRIRFDQAQADKFSNPRFVRGLLHSHDTTISRGHTVSRHLGSHCCNVQRSTFQNNCNGWHLPPLVSTGYRGIFQV
jgi:hypothetical protein